ncbi:aminodeoxychorismate synthase component I [Xanthobacter sp. AM11]|uniref:aminodeoxychorismate synthase component I n=1 Tax=Xanthobacter sp. AM11 TaxID=3380643 RepID=UPI0039BF1798
MHIVEIPYRDPFGAFQACSAAAHCAFLDSAAAGDPRARFSYIAADPFQVITSDAAGVRVDGVAVAASPFQALARALAAHRLPAAPGPVPFRSGAIGYLGYELGRHLERLPPPRPADPPLPEMVMGLYDTVVAFDHAAARAFILASGAPERGDGARRARARRRADELKERLEAAPAAAPAPDWTLRGTFRPERPRAEVEAAIARVIEYIRAGDIFQANLTQQMRARVPQGLGDLALYARLRALSPSPFAAFLRCGADISVLSASPERFLSLAPDGRVETRPIKGTRPRGADAAEDAALAAALLASEKDRAENLMIVDLLRNDLSRVSQVGSVKVPALCALETFASVHHLVSVVESRLQPGLGPVDLLEACFPGGSITGAPKIRAMEIIHELETAPRGVYCGSVAWIGFDGAMDSSIVIRTITQAGDTLLTQAGGGIVADSDPVDEYEESLVKLAPMLRALSGEGR